MSVFVICSFFFFLLRENDCDFVLVPLDAVNGRKFYFGIIEFRGFLALHGERRESERKKRSAV